ncbi:MAG: hypothetical protein OEV95_01815 [Gemmatimonadota bacterium]|nr:hypothetical protein [Gemmatimonadota bacterium]
MSPSIRRRSGGTDTAKGWATGAPGTGDILRRGAWYQIIGDSGDELVIEVDTHPRRLPREKLIVRAEPPDQWSIVVRTGVMRPTLSGAKVANTYAVCPDCTARQEFEGRPDTLICARCRRASKVDWSTTY